jgi:hypothetical protein
LARLAPKVPSLTTELTVVGPSGEPATDDGVDVTVDGQSLPKDRLGAAIDRDPGTYVVRAAGARVVASDPQTVELHAGDKARVALRVTVSAPVVAAPVSPEATEAAPLADTSSPRRGPSVQRTAGWIALGVGAAGLAGAVVSFGLRQSALSDLKEACPQYSAAPCDRAHQAAVLSDVDRGKTASTWLTVLGAVGVAGVAAGLTLVVTSSSRSQQAAVVLTPAGVAAAGTF